MVPVYAEKLECGSLTSEQKGLYTIFRADVQTGDVCRLYAVFEGGEAALGIPAPEHGRMTLCISVPTNKLPRGKLLRAELRPKTSGWVRFPGGKIGKKNFPPGRRMGNRYQFPWKAGDRLPCDEYLCFYHYVETGGACYLEVTICPDGKPEV